MFRRVRLVASPGTKCDVCDCLVIIITIIIINEYMNLEIAKQ